MRYYVRFTLSLTVALFLATASTQMNRGIGYAGPLVPAPSLTPECADGIEDIDQCPATGCGELGDAELNKAKNTEAGSGTITDVTIASIKKLPQPAKFDTGSARTAIKAAGEGRAVRVSGFFLRVKPEGGESCNCGLTRRAQTDVHLAMTEESDDLETESITAEITPRVRKHQGHGSKWEIKSVSDLEGDFVRVTGLLMLDTKHIPQLHVLPGERLNKGLQRFTNWEIHPILKIEVCAKSLKACKANKPGAFENF